MAILYVTEQGATIKHTAGRIVVRRADRIINDLPDFSEPSAKRREIALNV